jgi:hypothetical protein
LKLPYSVIACKYSSVPSYLSALNPCDQIFDWEELEYYYQVANRKPTDDDESEPEDVMPEEIEISPPKKRKNKKAAEAKKETTPPLPVVKEVPLPKEPEPTAVIDNPFLRSIKKSHN